MCCQINEMLLRKGQSRKEMSFGQLLGAGTLAGLAQMSITCKLSHTVVLRARACVD